MQKPTSRDVGYKKFIGSADSSTASGEKAKIQSGFVDSLNAYDDKAKIQSGFADSLTACDE